MTTKENFRESLNECLSESLSESLSENLKENLKSLDAVTHTNTFKHQFFSDRV